MESNTGIIILAAGSSSRLGQPKQLLDYKGKNFIQNIVKESFEFAGKATIVVSGSNSEEVFRSLKDIEVSICYNPDWNQGMGNSIKTGLENLLSKYPEIESCIITVCDQPYVTTEIFKQLQERQQITSKGIIACAYSRIIGVPVLFTKPYFDTLLQLVEKEGAKKILSKFSYDVASITFENGAIDIDTLEDYGKLKQ